MAAVKRSLVVETKCYPAFRREYLPCCYYLFLALSHIVHTKSRNTNHDYTVAVGQLHNTNSIVILDK